MAEPLFVLASIEITASALRRWLKSAPKPASAFNDWPDSTNPGTTEIPDVFTQAATCVADALVSYCVDSLAIGDGYIHCNYDEQTCALHFGAHFQYGHEAGAMDSAIFLCALLRSVSAVYTAKNPSRIYVFDSGADLLCIEIRKKCSRLLPSPENVQPDSWFGEWITKDLGDSDSLLAALLPPLARALKKQVSLGALRASPLSPYFYDCLFWTDGKSVYGCDGQVENADPKTFRKLTPGGGRLDMGSVFYADNRQLWYYPHFKGSLLQVQRIEQGAPVQGWRPHGLDGEPVLRCGDTVWAVASINYSDRNKTQSSIEHAHTIIQSQAGIPTWEKTYDIEYLRPTAVDGNSFSHIKDRLFEDRSGVYVQTAQGLIQMKGAAPGKTTYVGALYCNNELVFHRGHKSQCQANTESLRHIKDNFYMDDRHVYYLDYSEHDHALALRILKDAAPASFQIMRSLPGAVISGDEKHVWLNETNILGVTPNAVAFMGLAFWTDGHYVYYCDKVLTDASPLNFEVFPDSDYARQRDTVYYRGEIVIGADAASFVADDYQAAHDQHRQYDWGEEVMEGKLTK
jgi:hypothetical protein